MHTSAKVKGRVVVYSSMCVVFAVMVLRCTTRPTRRRVTKEARINLYRDEPIRVAFVVI